MMDFNSVLTLAATVACPLAIGGMMWWMVRDMNREEHPTKADPARPVADERLAALKQQRRVLEAEIAAVTRSAELEAEREQQEQLTVTKTQPVGASKRTLAQRPR
jgi:hypothetical protein